MKTIANLSLIFLFQNVVIKMYLAHGRSQSTRKYKEELFDEMAKVYEILRQHVTALDETAGGSDPIITEDDTLEVESVSEIDMKDIQASKNSEESFPLKKKKLAYNEGIRMFPQTMPVVRRNNVLLNSHVKYNGPSNRMYLSKQNHHMKGPKKFMRNSNGYDKSFRRSSSSFKFNKMRKGYNRNLNKIPAAQNGKLQRGQLDSFQKLNKHNNFNDLLISKMDSGEKLQTTFSIPKTKSVTEFRIPLSNEPTLQNYSKGNNPPSVFLIPQDVGYKPNLTFHLVNDLVEGNTYTSSDNLSHVDGHMFNENFNSVESVPREKLPVINTPFDDLLGDENKIESREKHDLDSESREYLKEHYQPYVQDFNFLQNPYMIAIISGTAVMVVLLLLAVGVYCIGKKRTAYVNLKRNKSPTMIKKHDLPARPGHSFNGFKDNKQTILNIGENSVRHSSREKILDRQKHTLTSLETINEESIKAANNTNKCMQNQFVSELSPPTSRKINANPSEKLKKLHKNVKIKQQSKIPFIPRTTQEMNKIKQHKNSPSKISKIDDSSSEDFRSQFVNLKSQLNVTADSENVKKFSIADEELNLPDEDLEKILSWNTVTDPVEYPFKKSSENCVSSLLTGNAKVSQRSDLSSLFTSSDFYLASEYKQEDENSPESLAECLSNINEIK